MSVVLGRIGDICEQIRGVTYSKEEAASAPAPGFKPVLRANNITEHGLSFEDLVYVPAERISARQHVKANDVVVAASSGSIDVVGKAARALVEFDGGFGAFCKVLRPGSEVDPGYFAHFFKTPAYRRRVSGLAAGANINNLRKEHIDDLEIVLPPLAEQRRIAAVLDKADALRAKRREAIAKLDQLLQSVFLDMFGDPIVNDHGFPVTHLAEVVATGRPITYGILKPGPDVQNGVPYVRVVDIRNGDVDASTVKRTSREIAGAYKRSMIQSGDLLMSIRGHVGRLGVVPESLEGANITQDTARISVGPEFERDYVLGLLNSDGIQGHMRRFTRGAAVQGINLKDVREIPVLVPPRSQQRKYAGAVAGMRNLRRSHAAQLSLASRMVSALQQQCFATE